MDKISHILIRKRLLAVVLLITFLFIALSGRLLFIQVLSGQKLQQKAYSQWLRDLPMRADRGDIVDSNGVVLAQSGTSYTLYARPNELKEKEKCALLLSKIVGISAEKLLEKLSKKGVSELTVAKSLTREQMIEIIGLDIQGFYITADSTRNYSFGNFLTQVLGFTNIDGVGQSGVEQYYNSYLKGVNGATLTETDLVGKKLNSNKTSYLEPIKGMTTQLTIDYNVQSFAEKATRDICMKYTPKSASCIVMSAKTGAIKAISSSPTFDLNNLPRDDMNALLAGSRNAIVCDAYEPGSTFKILTSAIGLETNCIKNSYYCNGASIVDGQRIKCWRSIGHGSQNFEKGIQNSCNCVFMDIALTVGAERMYSYFDKFGLGAKTGVDISGEAKGILLNRNAVKNVDIARIGFGQAIAVTPIQLASAVCSVVNGGYLHEPYVVDKIFDGRGLTAFQSQTKIRNRTISEKVSDEMKGYLTGVVKNGSGKNAFVAGFDIGGKTGTAQKYENGSIARGKYISSFVGYADVGDDTYVCLMLVDEPQGYVYYGSIVAAPYVGEIFKNIFAYRDIQPHYTDEEKALNETVIMPDLMDMTTGEASAALKKIGLQYEFSGEGGRVKYQVPSAGAEIKFKSVAFFAVE